MINDINSIFIPAEEMVEKLDKLVTPMQELSSELKELLLQAKNGDIWWNNDRNRNEDVKCQ